MKMKNFLLPNAIALAVALVFLSACGGGGDDEAGSPTAFSVAPNDYTLTAAAATAGGPPAGECGSGYVGDVFVYGGTAPYRLDNTMPDAILLSKTEVGERGGSFSVAFTGICFDPGSVVIVDKLDHTVTLTLHNKPAS